jgi:hypothetical protein
VNDVTFGNVDTDAAAGANGCEEVDLAVAAPRRILANLLMLILLMVICYLVFWIFVD